MAIKNIKTLLTQATSFPAAVEAKLPAGAPKVSTMLLDAANKVPDVPDFPVEIPDLPAPPELPELPIGPGGLKSPFVSAVEIRPVQEMKIIPSPAAGVIPEVQTRRGM